MSPIKRSSKKRSLNKTLLKNRINKEKNISNLKNILEFSNATPFQMKTVSGYVCTYCDDAFPEPADLRTHTKSVHGAIKLTIRVHDITDYNVKLDVEQLCCNICSTDQENLTTLKKHLADAHGKVIYDGVNNFILEFKLKPNVYECVHCLRKYETFKTLLQHMHTHYRNFTCDKCGANFSNNGAKNSHKATHNDKDHKCEFCDKIFGHANKLMYHVKKSHDKQKLLTKCTHCDEVFTSYYNRNAHLVKTHKIDSPYLCNICDRRFVLKSHLTRHIKKIHLMEKNYACDSCDFRSYDGKALRDHMVKHSGEKKFVCDICSKGYARKNTLMTHMLQHTNNRRFKCDLCSVTFVQKCSLKSHLLTNHNVNLSSSEIN